MRTRSRKLQFHKLRRRAEKETEVSDGAASRWDGSHSRLPAEFEKKQGAALVCYEIELQRAIAVWDIFRDRATGLARMDLVNSGAVPAKVRRAPDLEQCRAPGRLHQEPLGRPSAEMFKVSVGSTLHLRVVETRADVASELGKFTPRAAKDASTHAPVESGVPIAFRKGVHRDEYRPRVSRIHRDPNVVDLGRILVLLDLRLKVAADSVNKWRRERVCGHGFYFSPTEDDRLARLRRGFFFTSVRCAIFSIVPRRMYSWRIFSSISSRRSYSRFGFLRGPRLSA